MEDRIVSKNIMAAYTSLATEISEAATAKYDDPFEAFARAGNEMLREFGLDEIESGDLCMEVLSTKADVSRRTANFVDRNMKKSCIVMYCDDTPFAVLDIEVLVDFLTKHGGA